jgi:ribA/ribD-fused uncharacterized protein
MSQNRNRRRNAVSPPSIGTPVKSPSKVESDVTMKEMFKTLSAKIDKMDTSFQLLCNEVSEIRVEINGFKEIEKSLEFTQGIVDETKKDISDLKEISSKQEDKQAEMSHQIADYKLQNNILKERILQLDTYIRRENLKFSGISEETNELAVATQAKLREVFSKNLGISNPQGIEFQRCHRLGVKSVNVQKNRDVIVRFLRYEDRMTIWNNRFRLKGSGIYINEDLPIEVEQRRQKLYPIYREALNQKKKASLVADRLIVDSVRYSVDNLDNLPLELQLKNISTRSTDSAVLFHGVHSIYSNFHFAKFELDGKTFVTSEQCFQYEKARRCGDDETSSKIMDTIDPVQQYYLGRKLTPTQDQWDNVRAEQVMEMAVKAKFAQNEDLKNELLLTGKKQFIECNAHDKLWGVGLSINNVDALDKSKWMGQNLLGNVLVNVRESLK